MAPEDIKSARGNVTLYGVERFGKGVAEVAAAKFAARAAERAAGRGGATACSPMEWRVAGPRKTAAKVAQPPQQAPWTGYAAVATSHPPSNSRHSQVQVVAVAGREVLLPPPVQPSGAALLLLLPLLTA